MRILFGGASRSPGPCDLRSRAARHLRLCALSLALLAASLHLSAQPAAGPQPPLVKREFRGLWVATAANIDWPSRKGLAVDEQKAELVAILDRAVELHCNAIIFQVRSMCDAFYDSRIEPWSEYLSGTMGKAPEPFYDPLAFAIAEAHKRGLELHAWFNPYRVRANVLKTPAAANHISITHPELVRNWAGFLWLDPTEPATREYSLGVIQDVIRRYDIDAVHMDDYFYPYPGKELSNANFPDEAAWKRYQAAGGQLSRDDWRRSNIDTFIETLYTTIKKEKSWVKLGISPFGIWRSHQPAEIKGLSACDELYADSRKWLANGWVDYLAPQLYWPIEPKEQSFPVLLKWWEEQNVKHRHLWPGLNLDQKKTPDASETIAQINITRQEKSNSGCILWHTRRVQANQKGIADALAREAYQEPALVPAFPWMNATAPAAPKLELKKEASGLQASWIPGGGKIWLWVLQTKAGETWKTEIIPGDQMTRALTNAPLPEAVALTAVNRFGNASAAVSLLVK